MVTNKILKLVVYFIYTYTQFMYVYICYAFLMLRISNSCGEIKMQYDHHFYCLVAKSCWTLL